MNSVSCCSHKYLGRLARAEKRGCMLLSSLPDFRNQGSQFSTFPQKGEQEKKSNAFRESLQGEHEENTVVYRFQHSFQRCEQNTVSPCYASGGGMHAPVVDGPHAVTMVLCWHCWHCWQRGGHEAGRQPPLLSSGELPWNGTWPVYREGLIFGCRS